MIVTGILRHYLTVLLQSPPKPLSGPKLRESRSLLLSINLRTNASVLPRSSFSARKAYLVAAYNDGKFLADPEARGKPKANPMGSPEMMEGMMGMMKGNVAMMVPQTLIMGWINAFFAGFVLCKSSVRFSLCLVVETLMIGRLKAGRGEEGECTRCYRCRGWAL